MGFLLDRLCAAVRQLADVTIATLDSKKSLLWGRNVDRDPVWLLSREISSILGWFCCGLKIGLGDVHGFCGSGFADLRWIFEIGVGIAGVRDLAGVISAGKNIEPACFIDAESGERAWHELRAGVFNITPYVALLN